MGVCMNRAEKTGGRPAKLGVWRWLAIAGLALLLAWVGVFAYVQWRPTPPLTAALLAPVAPQPGRNAFAALWLVKRKVPPSQIEAVAAADVADFLRWSSDRRGPWIEPSKQFGENELPLKSDPPWCDRQTLSCLHTVQANLPGYRKLVATHAATWQRVQALAQYDLYHSPLPPDVATPMAPFAVFNTALTALATRFAQAPAAQRGQVMQDFCQHLLTTRRLSERDGTNLIFQMVGTANVHHGLRLLVDMRLEAPGLSLPADCSEALAPRADWNQAICQALHGQTLEMQTAFAQALDGRVLNPSFGGKTEVLAQGMRWLAMGSGRLASEEYARGASRQCESEALASVAAGQKPADERASDLVVSVPYAMRAPGGVLLLDMAVPAWAQYTRRLADREARRMAGRSWLWLQAQIAQQPALAKALAAHDAAPLNAALAARPADAHMPNRHLTVVAGEGGALLLRLPLWQFFVAPEQMDYDLPLALK